MRLGFRVGIRLLVAATCRVDVAQQKRIELSSALPDIGHALPELIRTVQRNAARCNHLSSVPGPK